MSVAIHRIVVRGRVQGVGFRAFVEEEALARSLAGFVRNRRDGSVEALFAGPPAVVAAMIAACRQGPPAARVEAVEVFETSGDAAFTASGGRFVVLATE